MKLIIQNSRVVAEATADYTGPMEWIIAPEGYVAGSFVLPDQPAPIPQEVTMGQCRLALFDKHGIETDEEFLALTDMLPEDQRARARIELSTRPTVRFDNPLVQGVCAAKGWNAAELFIHAAAQ